MYISERGDIFYLEFDPSAGHEMQCGHYALAVSPKTFNWVTGLVFACPISQGNTHLARGMSMLSTLHGAGTHTQGNIHCHQMKSLDWQTRQAKFKERVPDFVLQDVLARLSAVLFDE